MKNYYQLCGFTQVYHFRLEHFSAGMVCEKYYITATNEHTTQKICITKKKYKKPKIIRYLISAY